MKQSYKLAGLYLVLFGILGRLIPHPANFTPITALSVFSGQNFPRKWGVVMILITMAVSDWLLHLFYGYPAFGSWSLFTYTGFAATTIASSLLKMQRVSSLFLFAILSESGFWLWTNFGVWYFGHLTTIYPKNLSGFIACYVAALPFLRNALIGSVIWLAIIFGSYRFVAARLKLQEV